MTDSRMRPLLWAALILSLAANAVASTIGATVISIVFGVLTLAFGATLVVGHYRHRQD